MGRFSDWTADARVLLQNLAACAASVYHPLASEEGQRVLDAASGTPMRRLAQKYFQGLGGGWRVMLFEDPATGGRFVAIEGTTPNLSNGVTNFLFTDVPNGGSSFLSGAFAWCLKVQANTLGRLGLGIPPDALNQVEPISPVTTWVPKMQHQIEEWKKIAPIHALVGHSEGGFFAARVASALGLRSVTFNAHDPHNRNGGIDFRLRDDFLSRLCRQAGFKYDTITAPGNENKYSGHSMLTVVDALHDPDTQVKDCGADTMSRLEKLVSSLPPPRVPEAGTAHPPTAQNALYSPIEKKKTTWQDASVVLGAGFASAFGAVAGCYASNAITKKCWKENKFTKEEQGSISLFARAGAVAGMCAVIAGVLLGARQGPKLSIASLKIGVLALGRGAVGGGLLTSFCTPMLGAVIGGVGRAFFFSQCGKGASAGKK